MAPPIISDPQPSTTNRLKNNLSNPLPLSASQEAEVRKLYYARVRTRCADEIKGE
jgi:COX assembly protein 1